MGAWHRRKATKHEEKSIREVSAIQRPEDDQKRKGGTGTCACDIRLMRERNTVHTVEEDRGRRVLEEEVRSPRGTETSLLEELRVRDTRVP